MNYEESAALIIKTSEELQTIEKEYKHINVTEFGLNVWINHCLSRSLGILSKLRPKAKQEIWFEDCRIVYLEKKMLFSVTRDSVDNHLFDSNNILPFEDKFISLFDCEGKAEITIDSEVYLERFFGVNAATLKAHVALLRDDLGAVSEAIRDDISLWCTEILNV